MPDQLESGSNIRRTAVKNSLPEDALGELVVPSVSETPPKTGRQLRKLKDEFFSLAAHEIRTPITVIKAQAQLAERFHAQGRLQGELMEKTLRTFVQESDRLARLCNDLLDIARLDSDCFELHMSEFELGGVLNETLNRYRTQNPSHIFIFDHSATSSVQVVYADRERVAQIFSNLLNNSVRFSPNGGTIEVQLRCKSDAVLVSVRDQGVGISPDKLKNIFKRYYQAHQTGLKGPYGLGLSLYLCREALRRMNGSIRVKSDGPGLGSEFIFTLPTGNAPDGSKQE